MTQSYNKSNVKVGTYYRSDGRHLIGHILMYIIYLLIIRRNSLLLIEIYYVQWKTVGNTINNNID